MTGRRQQENGTPEAQRKSEAQHMPEAQRKPPGMSFTSWVDQRINEAAERGAFDDLPGAGKPLPRRPSAADGQAWLRDYLQREGVSSEELLPTPLKLRKEIERLAEGVQDLRSEQEVRDVVADLNRRIIDWRRFPLDGPPVFLPLVNSEAMVSRWRDRPQPSPQPARDPSAAPEPRSDPPRRRRWRHRGR
jgi:Domain of unknown function (DUF1992)